MDSNLKIIQHVQKRPILYAKSNNFAGRSAAWKEIADILKTDASFVKSRWHLLRTRFMEEYSSVLKGNSTPFKYIAEMSFLTNYINLNAYEMYSKENDQYRNVPEFNITQKDLDEVSDDDSSSEFIELELDEETQSELAQIPFEGAEETRQNEYIEPIYIEDYSSNSQSHDEVETSTRCKQKQPETETHVEIKVSPKSELKKPEEEKLPMKRSSSGKSPAEKSHVKTVAVKRTTFEKSTTENKMSQKTNPEEISGTVKKVSTEITKASIETDVGVTEPQKSCKNETTVAKNNTQAITETSSEKSVSTPTPKPENYRCEDTIFGELVVATLREMHPDKKKSVKREIMNLLFT